MRHALSGTEPNVTGWQGVFVVFLLAIVALMVAVIVWSIRNAKRRRDSIASVVAANGFTYLAEDRSLVDAFEGAPFGRGSARRARDIVSGTIAGGPFQTFAYYYETQTTNSDGTTQTTVHPFQVTWIPLPAPFPHVRFTPDSVWMRAFGALGGHAIETESAAFNDQWRVRASDERIAHAILTGPMIERLLLADVADRVVVFQGARLMTFVGKASDLSELVGVVGMLQQIAGLVPPFLLADLRAPGGA